MQKCDLSAQGGWGMQTVLLKSWSVITRRFKRKNALCDNFKGPFLWVCALQNCSPIGATHMWPLITSIQKLFLLSTKDIAFSGKQYPATFFLILTISTGYPIKFMFQIGWTQSILRICHRYLTHLIIRTQSTVFLSSPTIQNFPSYLLRS